MLNQICVACLVLNEGLIVARKWYTNPWLFLQIGCLPLIEDNLLCEVVDPWTLAFELLIRERILVFHLHAIP